MATTEWLSFLVNSRTLTVEAHAMSDRSKNWLSIALISAIVAVTSAWAVTEHRVGTLERKVDAVVCYLMPKSIECLASNR